MCTENCRAVRGRDKGFLNTVREFRTERQRLVGYDGQPVTAHKEVCHVANNRGGTAVFFTVLCACRRGRFLYRLQGGKYDDY